jgi:hypothetical protein
MWTSVRLEATEQSVCQGIYLNDFSSLKSGLKLDANYLSGFRSLSAAGPST